MVVCCGFTLWESEVEYDDGIQVIDNSADKLSHVGAAAYGVLRKKHRWNHHLLWNVSSGNVIGELHQTPPNRVFGMSRAMGSGHDDWFPQKMAEIMSRTTVWW
mmetsp:Transcript_6628/g.8253  ORF Transcript_6628/g.8253 Transcript_6628/m.8253 type:complete len:103 (+) Transcript_6628:413-721(+)